MTADRKTVAYHEAGHAVVAFDEHRRLQLADPVIEYAEITLDADDYGRVKLSRQWPTIRWPLAEINEHETGYKDDVHAYLRFYMAGISAEVIYTGKLMSDVYSHHDKGDVRAAKRYLQFDEVRTERELHSARDYAQQFVATQWPAVKRIAHELLRLEHLDNDQVAALLGDNVTA